MVAATGTGPVDAAYVAVTQALGIDNIKVRYQPTHPPTHPPYLTLPSSLSSCRCLYQPPTHPPTHSFSNSPSPPSRLVLTPWGEVNCLPRSTTHPPTHFLPIQLLEFAVSSVTAGIDALGEVTVRLEDLKTSKIYYGRSANTDVVVAATQVRVSSSSSSFFSPLMSSCHIHPPTHPPTSPHRPT